MSRGLGSVQRQVLAAFADLGGSADVHGLAVHIFGNAPIGGSRYESVRRAVQSLVSAGLVRQCQGRGARIRIDWDDGSRSWHDEFEITVGKPQDLHVSNTYKSEDNRA